jgi:hypothetical protein
MSRYTFRLTDIVVVLLLLTLSSTTITMMDATSMVKLVVTVIGFYAVGELLTGYDGILQAVPSQILSGFKIILGGVVYSIVLLVFNDRIVQYLLYAGALISIVVFRKTYAVDRRGLLTMLPFLLFLLNNEELGLASSPTFYYTGSDYFYYTAIVQSIASNFDLGDAIFHRGLPINFQSLPFLFPASLCFNLGVPAHLALLGLTMPLLKIFSFGAISASIFYMVTKVRTDIAKPYLVAGVISLALVLMAPINPVYLAKLDFKNAIFLGEGYLLPMGSPGFALGLLFFGLLNFYAPSMSSLRTRETLMFGFLLGSVVAAKIALFIPLFIFYSMLLLLEFWNDKEISLRKCVPLGVALLFAVASYSFFLGDLSGITRTTLSVHGYLPGFFQVTSSKYNLPWGLPVFLGMLAYMIVMWVGLKWLLFAFVVRKWQTIPKNFFSLFLAAALTVLVTFLPALFVKVVIVDEAGITLQDATFDMGQFLRSGLFILNCLSAVIIALIWIDTEKKTYLMVLKATILAWFAITAFSLLSTLTRKTVPRESAWYVELMREFKEQSPKLMAMRGNRAHSGQVLCAQGVFPWWTSVKRGDESGYVGTASVNYRNALLTDFLDEHTKDTKRRDIIARMNEEGVDYLVATPENLLVFQSSAIRPYLFQPQGCQWLFKLTKNNSTE